VVAGGYRLVGESWESLQGGGSTRTLHRYDGKGMRSSSVFFTADTTQPATGQILYSYDDSGRLTKSVTISGLDTLGSVESGYDPSGRIVVKRILGRNRELSYIDSFSYREGRIDKSWQTSSSGSVAWYRVHDSIDAGSIVDTLFEPTGESGFKATQVIWGTLDTQGRMVRETTRRLQLDSTWVTSGVVLMSYQNGWLMAVASYDSEPEPTRLIDSSSYAYDANGNRIEERYHDASRVATDLFQYFWETISVTSGVRLQPTADPLLSGDQIRLPPHSVAVFARGLDGRLLWSADVVGLRSISMPSQIRTTSLISVQTRSGVRTELWRPVERR